MPQTNVDNIYLLYCHIKQVGAGQSRAAYIIKYDTQTLMRIAIDYHEIDTFYRLV